MRILIIGGTGFLGGRTAGYLLQRGHQVTLFHRGYAPGRLAPQPHLDTFRGDRHDARDLAEVQRHGHFDAVFDFVAYEPGESRLAIEAFSGRIGRFIHCSTVSVYMVSDQVVCPITEDQDQAPLMPFWERNPFGMEYGINKRACEELLWQAHTERRLNVSMLRPTFISGPHDPARRDFFWIERLLQGGSLLVPGSGDFAFQSVFVDDAARAFADLLEHEVSIGKVYNLAAEEILSLNEYLQLLGTIMQREPHLIHVEQTLFDQLPFSHHPQGDVFPFNTRRPAFFSLHRIKADLGYHATPIATWLAETVTWFTQHFSGHSVGWENRDQELAWTWKAE